MKKQITNWLACTVLLLGGWQLSAQRSPAVLLNPAPAPTADTAVSRNTATRAREWTDIIQMRTVGFNAAALQSERLQVALFDGQTIEFERFKNSNNDSNTWLGRPVNGLGSISIQRLPSGGCIATIFGTGGVYELRSLSAEQHFLLQVQPPNPIEEGCENVPVNPNWALRHHSHATPDAAEKIGNPVLCNLRVLVLYTPSGATWATTNSGSIGAHAQQCINTTNTTYQNSGIVFRAELAGAFQSTDERDNVSDDLDDFTDNSDGKWDEVHALRDRYQADVCVLIGRYTSGGLCGKAEEIGADESEAFCVVDANCAISNLSFPHEIGHLQGARHDLYVDGTDSPFDFGHGFVYLAGEWRTVMAYNDECDDNDVYCDRLPYFSTPLVNNPADGVALGTAADQDNARVLNETTDEVRLFRTQPDNLSLTNETLNGDLLADLTATTSITAENNYFVLPTADVRLRAGARIHLRPGFAARAGARFVASIETVEACSKASRPAEMRSAEVADFESGALLSVSPNPFAEQFNVQVDLAEEGPIVLSLVDPRGALVHRWPTDQVLSRGRHQFFGNQTDLAPGLYLVELQTTSGRYLNKVIKL